MDFSWTTVQDVVTGYEQFLLAQNPSYHRPFANRLIADMEAAQSEAIVFSFLHTLNLNPALLEKPGQGGVDFKCRPAHRSPFVLEVTCLNSEAVAQQSGWPNVAESAGAFRLVTAMLRTKICSKVPQLAKHSEPIPRILAVPLTHIGASAFFSCEGAKCLLVSDYQMSIPIGGPVEARALTTDLENSIFFRFDKHKKVEPCRQSISAILLVAIAGDRSNVVGILNPAPHHPFEIEIFPLVPFLKVANWPLGDGSIKIEWTIAYPEPAPLYHNVIE